MNTAVISQAIRRARLLRALTRVALARRSGAGIDGSVMITGPLEIRMSPGSRVNIGKGVVLNARSDRNSLEARGPNLITTVLPGASVAIGDDAGLTSVTLSAATSIRIGARVLLGAGVLVTDSDHHVIEPRPWQPRRHLGPPPSDPRHAVTIEDDVFIGARAIVLKGVTVGRGSVIGAGSVVTRDIPPFSLAAGNPARIVRALQR